VILNDVNILLYAHRNDAADHSRFRDWLDAVTAAPEPFGLSEIVLGSFVRVVTNPKILNPPTPLQYALEFCESLRNRPNAVLVTPGTRHWEIFTDLCLRARATGDLVQDAYLAALAIESGCEWITLDRDFARFPGLRWRHPF
jgi:toxin-antitoxin system PIN domain toxin